MNAQEKCIGYEAIRKEADDSGENVNPRLIVNPEFVEDLDKSDGANQFDPEDEKKFNEALGEDY